MIKVAIVLLLALMISGCGNSSSDVQTAASGVWQAQLSGGNGAGQGFSFNTDFTVSGSGGTLTFGTFQFLTSGTCFPVTGAAPSGTMSLTVNQNNFQVTGTLTLSVSANGNVLTLNGNVTGTENGTEGTQLSDGVVTGTWTLTGSGANGCTDSGGTSGSFKMTQATSG